MTGGRYIEDGDVHLVVDHVQHFAYQHSGTDGYRFARLQVDLQAVFPLEILYQLNQSINVVPFAGDVVPSTQVEPLHARQELAEFLFKYRGRPLQRLEQLFAEGVEVQAIHPGQ